MIVEILNIIGVFAFAYYGAAYALQAKKGLLLTAVCAFLTAFGGGTIRELMLANSPAYMHHYELLFAAAIGLGGAAVLSRYFLYLKTYTDLLDAIGLGTFAYIGAFRAEQYDLGGWGIIGFALLTAVGGGLLSATVTKRRLYVIDSIMYILPPLTVACLCCVWPSSTQDQLQGLIIVSVGYALRVTVILHHSFRDKLFTFSSNTYIRLRSKI